MAQGGVFGARTLVLVGSLVLVAFFLLHPDRSPRIDFHRLPGQWTMDRNVETKQLAAAHVGRRREPMTISQRRTRRDPYDDDGNGAPMGTGKSSGSQLAR